MDGGVPQRPTGLLPGEGDVGTYGSLRAAGSKGDDLTPDHIPAHAYMQARGPGSYKHNDGVAMNMQQPRGPGGRHRQTSSYGARPDLKLTPRQVLARDIWNRRKVYREAGLYGSFIRQSLLRVTRNNYRSWPGYFSRPRNNAR